LKSVDLPVPVPPRKTTQRQGIPCLYLRMSILFLRSLAREGISREE